MSKQYITTPKRLVHNTIFNCATLVSSAAITFFLIRFFLAQLGEIRYGVWVLIGSVFQYRRLLDMGMNSSIDRYIPMNLARRDDNAIQRVVSTSFFFFVVLAVLLGLLTLLLYNNIGVWFSIAPDMVGDAGMLALVVGFSFVLAVPLQMSAALLCGIQRYDILNVTELLMLLLRTILAVVLLQQGYGLLTLGFVFGGGEVLTKIVQFIFARRLLPNVSVTLKSIDLALLKEMLAYGINTCLYTTGGLLIVKATDLVIAVFIGTAEVSQFAVAVAGILLLSELLRAFTAAIKPAVSDLDARDEHSHVREISFLMQKYSLLLIVPAACFFMVMGKELLYVWVGEKFQQPNVVDKMGVILAVLTVGHGLRLAQYSNFVVLVGKGDHKLFGLLTVLTGLLSVSASVVCVKVFHWGLLAIAWANCLPMVLVSGILLPIYFNMKMRISLRESIVRIWWPALLGCMPAIIVICGWKHLHSPASWSGIAMVALVSAGLTGISAWCFSMTPRERERLLKALVLRRAQDASAGPEKGTAAPRRRTTRRAQRYTEPAQSGT